MPSGCVEAYKSAPQWSEFLDIQEIPLSAPESGDSNANGVVNIADAVNTANYALGNEVKYIDLEAADVNGDGNITLSDASATVTLILEQEIPEEETPDEEEATEISSVSFIKAEGYNLLEIDDFEAKADESVDVEVRLHDSMSYVAMQGDITVPEGMVIEEVKAGERVEGSHTLLMKRIDSRRVRVAIFDPGNSEFDRNSEEPMLTLRVKTDGTGSGSISVINAIAVDNEAREYPLKSVGGNDTATTAIEPATDSNIRVVATAGKVTVSGAEGERILIHDAAGMAVADFTAVSGTEGMSLLPGVYVVTVGSSSVKVLVK